MARSSNDPGLTADLVDTFVRQTDAFSSYRVS